MLIRWGWGLPWTTISTVLRGPWGNFADFNLYAFEVHGEVVPEPAGILLLGTGCGIIGLVRYRRFWGWRAGRIQDGVPTKVPTVDRVT